MYTKMFSRHYDNTYIDFIYNDFTFSVFYDFYDDCWQFKKKDSNDYSYLSFPTYHQTQREGFETREQSHKTF